MVSKTTILFVYNADSGPINELKDYFHKLLKQENYKNFIFHCFSEDLSFAKECIEFSPNCKISFS